MSWWRGTLIVAERTIRENLRSRSFKVLTLFVVALAIGGITVPQLVGDDDPTYELATVAAAPAALRAALDAAGDEAGFEVEYVEVADEAALREAVRAGEATAGLTEERLYTSVTADGTFAAVVGQTVVGLETSRALTEAGLSPEDLAALGSIAPPEQVTVESEQEQARSGLAFGTGIVLYMAITFAGTAIATAVSTEKSSRISEVLLAVLRPSQTLVGTVLAVGLLALAQLLVAAVPLAVAVRFTDSLGLPDASAADLVLAIGWFLAGFVLFAFLFAAAAALVDKVTEVSTAIMPVNGLLLVAYLVAIVVVSEDPRSVGAVVASIFPISAPIAMPVRWAAGDVPAYQLVLAFVLTLLTAVLLARLAALVYGRALTVTGRRLSLRQALRLARERP